MKHWNALNKDERIVAITTLRDLGKTKADIAGGLQVSRDALYGFLNRQKITGIPARKSHLPDEWVALSLPEKVEKVRGLEAAGLTLAQIADALGMKASRLREFCWRNNLGGVSDRVIVIRAKPPEVPDDPIDPAVWEPLGPPANFLSSGCRWPVGDPDAREVCGGKVSKRHYCETHYAMAYRPARLMTPEYLDAMAALDEKSGVRPGKKSVPVSVGKKIWSADDE